MEDLQSTQLAVIENSIELFRQGGAILKTHQGRALKGEAVLAAVLSKIEKAESENDMALLAEADRLANNALANCNKAYGEMEEARKGLTQMLDEIRKMFIAEEKKLDLKIKDGLPAKIQSFRNRFAAKIEEERLRKLKEAQEKIAKAQEETDIVSAISQSIASTLLNTLKTRLEKMIASFNSITLDTIEEMGKRLEGAKVEFNQDHISAIWADKSIRVPLSMRIIKHTTDEIDAIVDKAMKDFSYDDFVEVYRDRVSAIKQELIDRLPSKKAELERIAKLERENNEADLKAEQEAKEKREREALEKLNKEATARQTEEEGKIELEKAGSYAQALFDASSESTVEHQSAGGGARSGFLIEVISPAGWVELFTFWFQREGMAMDMAKLEKMDFGKIKRFAEAEAKEKKDGEAGTRIESKNIKYTATVKAVNKK